MTAPIESQIDNQRDAAFQAAVWQTIEARAKQLKDEARSRLASIPVGEAVAGRWGDRIVAKATMAKGRTKLVVTEPQKFLDWVKRNHPAEIVEAVNPAYLKAVEARAKDLGLGAVIDAAGEVIPGVEIQVGEPTVSVRREPDADTIIAELFATGRVTLDGIDTTPALTAAVVDGEIIEDPANA